jgi:hypothetical protein
MPGRAATAAEEDAGAEVAVVVEEGIGVEQC